VSIIADGSAPSWAHDLARQMTVALAKVNARLTALETTQKAYGTRLTTIETTQADHETRIAALENP